MIAGVNAPDTSQILLDGHNLFAKLEMLHDLNHKQRRLLSRLWTKIKLRQSIYCSTQTILNSSGTP